MRNPMVAFCLLAVLALSACGAQSTVVAQPGPTSEPIRLDLPTCSSLSVSPPVDPTLQALVPPVSEEDWTEGKPDAPITILEYSDFQ